MVSTLIYCTGLFRHIYYVHTDTDNRLLYRPGSEVNRAMSVRLRQAKGGNRTLPALSLILVRVSVMHFCFGVVYPLSLDLTSLFHWNTKQLFLYLDAEYINKDGVSE